ncbi:MAG: DNA polymerase I [Anaerolineales bacterium]|nr:DNA polymerase I [Anaerolineales bacterium]
MADKRKVLYLIDGHALAYRTYFALTSISGDNSRWITKSGEPTAGTYGFVSVLLNLLEKDQPDYLAVSFDLGRTFRDDLYADYKGTRDKMPDELAVQIERIQEVVRVFKIPILTAENYEADDVLGTAAQLAVQAGVDVKIITGDRDLLQLATEHITINLAGQKLSEAKDYGPAEVQARFGLNPQQFIHYKALVGDKSDNIPGVAGVGEKTATELLQKYDTLDNLYAHLDEVPNRFRSKLEAGKDAAYLSLKLSTIVCDVDIALNLEACVAGRYDRQEVFELFRVLEFNSLLRRLGGAGESAPAEAAASAPAAPKIGAGGQQMALFGQPAPGAMTPGLTPPVPARLTSGPTATTVVTDEAGLAALVAALEAAPFITFDVETTGLDELRSGLVGLALCVKAGEGYYIPVGHTGEGAGPQLPLAQVIAAITPAMTNPAIPKYGHNLKFDYLVLARAGVQAAPLAFDTMLAEWLCDPASHSLGLKKLTFVRLGIEMTEIKELIGTGKKQLTMDQVPVAAAAPYAAADVDMTTRLQPILEAELAQKGQLKLLHEMEMPLLPILAEMERTGITLDSELLGGMSGELQRRLTKIEQKIYKLAGYEFNINSTQQLAKALFENERVALRPQERSRKTASGSYSTAADVLEELRGEHEVIDLILEQRELSKLKSTYVDALPLAVNPDTGRVHTTYKQSGAVTGRIASEDPNLQNIPIRTELGREVRKAFIAPRGWRLVAADYSQIELRIAAHVSQDATLLEAFRRGEDIHAATAAAVLGVDADKVTKEQRRQAKTVNFGILYGQGAFGLTRTTGFTLAEAEAFIKTYFERLPGLKAYLDQTKQFAAEHGYVETLLGRRRYFPGLSLASNTREGAIARARAEREAINAPIQGTAADIIKMAMLRLPSALKAAGLQARMLLQVHDELVVECKTAEVKATAHILREVMEHAFQLDIPLGVEVRSGQNWEDMQPVKAH